MIGQPSFQSFDVDGVITEIMPGYGNKLATLRVVGLKGLIVPLNEADQHQIGDILTVKVCIDKVTNMSRAYRLDKLPESSGVPAVS